MTTEKAIEILKEQINHEFSCEIAEAYIVAIKALKQPERKKGKWEMKPDPYGFFEEIPVCPECGCTTKLREKYPYCPYCGADMREE